MERLLGRVGALVLAFGLAVGGMAVSTAPASGGTVQAAERMCC